jgi:hypothetical protein
MSATAVAKKAAPFAAKSSGRAALLPAKSVAQLKEDKPFVHLHSILAHVA